MIYAMLAPKRDIRKVILNKEIYDRISDDNSPKKEDFIIPYDSSNFIGGYISGKIASLFIVHGKKMHFMVLKEFRKYSKELLEASFVLWPRSVYVEIPSLYQSVINFSKNFGFKEFDILRNGHLKNGVSYDCHKLLYEVK